MRSISARTTAGMEAHAHPPLQAHLPAGAQQDSQGPPVTCTPVRITARMEATAPSVLEISPPVAALLTSWATNASIEAVKATVSMAVPACRVRAALKRAAVSPDTSAAPAKSTGVTTVGTGSASPRMGLLQRGISLVAAQMAQTSPAVTHVIPMNTVPTACAL